MCVAHEHNNLVFKTLMRVFLRDPSRKDVLEAARETEDADAGYRPGPDAEDDLPLSPAQALSDGLAAETLQYALSMKLKKLLSD